MKLLPSLVIAFVAANAIAQTPERSPRTPPDISTFVTPAQLKALDAAMKAHVEQAQKAFPQAKARFLAGLRKGESLLVTARLYDECGRSELVFISVARIEADIIEGRIGSRPHVATHYRLRDRYAFPESQLVDWLITYPDGTDEGNFVGRFMDSHPR